MYATVATHRAINIINDGLPLKAYCGPLSERRVSGI